MTERSIRKLMLPFDATLSLPGSKSIANRAIIAACLAEGETIIERATPCDDVARLVDGIITLGFDASWLDRESGRLRIRGGIPRDGGHGTIDCDNGGTTLRFLATLAALVPGTWILTGNDRMRERPVDDLTKALRTLGGDVESDGANPPVRARGGLLLGGETTLDASRSSQFLTSLLLAGPAMPDGLTVTLKGPATSPTYLDLTREVITAFGAEVAVGREGLQWTVRGRYRSPGTYRIQADWSAAGAFEVLASLTGSRLVTDAPMDSSHGDARVPETVEFLLDSSGNVGIDSEPFPDQVMNLAVAAAFRQGGTSFLKATNLRHKECDRLAVTTQALRSAGVDIDETVDGLRIEGPSTPVPATLDPEGDHRMAMAYAILGCVAGGIVVGDPGCVSKSYPNFWVDLDAVTSRTRCVALVGMRGAGKTTAGKILADELGLPFIDTDEVFVERHGPIADFVAAHDWSEFRELEEAIVLEAIAPGRIVALGGGAVESDKVRARLKASTLCVWLDPSLETLAERVEAQGAARPSLTGGDVVSELSEVLESRRVYYESVSVLRTEGAVAAEDLGDVARARDPKPRGRR